jgi:7-carboxy-7-deazaguanine synthase
MFKVCEVFRSVQGEGIDIGMPMIFIRFNGCNLACTWCDTVYASREGNPFEEVSVEDLVKKIEEFPPTMGITFTGGEPFIQDKDELDKLIYELKGRGYFVNIETNGKYLPELNHGDLVDRFSISPKLLSSGNADGVNMEELAHYLQLYPRAMFLKFVIGDEADFNQMMEILNGLGGADILKNIPIVVQPNINHQTAESIEEQTKGYKTLLDMLLMGGHAKEARDFNIRIIPQFHKYIWANKRAV